MITSNRSRLSQKRPKLDDAALYGLAGEVVGTLLPHTEAHPAALLVEFLSGFGIMAANPAGPWPHATADGADHAACLNVLVVGESSRARKSSAFHQIRNLLHAVDSDFIATQMLGGYGSGEALIDDLADSEDKRMWYCEHEFSRILTVSKREGSVLSPVMRQAWDGVRIQVRTRKKRVIADNVHMAVVGHITADELRTKVADTDIANGFLNRFLVVSVRRPQLRPNGRNLPEPGLRRLARLVSRRLASAKTIEVVGRTEKAESMWARLYSQMARDDPGGVLGALTARSEAQVLRLSIVYALTDGCPSIKVQHLRAASALWSYCRDSLAYIFGRGVVAETIFAAADQAGSVGLSKSQIYELFSGHQRREEIDAALEMLERDELIKITENKRRTGRPETRIAKNSK